MATERYNESEPVNLGSAFEISINYQAELIAQLTGLEGRIVWDTSKPKGQPCRKLDTSRGERLFGLKANMPFEQRLTKTIEWYRRDRLSRA